MMMLMHVLTNLQTETLHEDSMMLLLLMELLMQQHNYEPTDQQSLDQSSPAFPFSSDLSLGVQIISVD